MPKLLFLVRNMNCAYNTNIQLTLEPLKLCLNLVLTVKMEGEKNEKLNLSITFWTQMIVMN